MRKIIKKILYLSIAGFIGFSLAASHAHAAFARVQNKTATSATTSVTATFTQTPTVNNLMVATVYSGASNSVTAISGWTKAAGEDDSLVHSMSIFYKVAGASEASAVTATSTGAGSMHLIIIEYSYPGATAFTLDQTNKATSAAANSLSAGSITTTNANELIVATLGIAGSGTVPTYTNSFTNVNNTTRNFTGDLFVTSTGTYSTTVGYTGTAALLNADIVSFYPTVSNTRQSNFFF